MRRWTRVLEQVVTAYATVAVTRWVRMYACSSLVESIALIFAAYRACFARMGSLAPPVARQARTAFRAYDKQFKDWYVMLANSDYEEKHDEPSPYPLSDNQPQASSGFAKRRTETQRAPPPPKSESDRVAEQIREIQEKLRRR